MKKKYLFFNLNTYHMQYEIAMWFIQNSIILFFNKSISSKARASIKRSCTQILNSSGKLQNGEVNRNSYIIEVLSI